MRTASFYTLSDPDGAVRYVGKAMDARKRFAGHLREKRRKTPLYRWIATLRKQGQTPVMTVVCTALGDAWQQIEVDLIAQYRDMGAQLLNVAEGGDEPACSHAVRSANAKALNARLKADPKLARLRDAKRELSRALREGLVREGTRAKMRLLAARMPAMFGEWATI